MHATHGKAGTDQSMLFATVPVTALLGSCLIPRTGSAICSSATNEPTANGI